MIMNCTQTPSKLEAGMKLRVYHCEDDYDYAILISPETKITEGNFGLGKHQRWRCRVYKDGVHYELSYWFYTVDNPNFKTIWMGQ